MPVQTTTNRPTEAQVRYVNSLRVQRALEVLTLADFASMTRRDASREIDRLRALPVVQNDDRVRAGGGYLAGLPFSKYAVRENGVITFWEIKAYRNTTYLRLLVGAPGSFRKVRVGYARAILIAKTIRENPVATAQAFSRHYTVCCVCCADLSDPVSVDLGIGPVCRTRFGL